MCWSNTIAIPLVLKKPLRVYKLGNTSIFDSFISLHQNFMYIKSQTVPTVEINPQFVRHYPSRWFSIALWNYDTFYIDKGYHSYLTEEMARYCKGECDDIGIFEIPADATIYVDYKYREVVSTDIKY